MQNWKKLGLIYFPDGKPEWMQTHAMMPVIDILKNDNARIYFSARDNRGRSQGAYIEVNLNDPFRILNVSQEPVLKLGQLGAFDDSGIMPTCIVSNGGEKYLYYNGWTLGKNVPFFSFNGVAVSDDGGKTFVKKSRGPAVLYSNETDPYSTFAPYVIKDHDKWKIWYVSLIKWSEEEGKLKHFYNIRYAESDDGINFKREGVVCIDFKKEFEYALNGSSYKLGTLSQKSEGDNLLAQKEDDFVNPNKIDLGDYVYDPNGKRDPFKPFTDKPETLLDEKTPALLRYDISQFRVAAVLDDSQGGMFAMVEDSAGIGYPVRSGDAIGINNGKVLSIQKDKIEVLETITDAAGQTKQELKTIKFVSAGADAKSLKKKSKTKVRVK